MNLPNEDGQGLIEYAVILLLVAAVVVALLVILEPRINQIISTITGG